jgi:hypothetical protein
MAILSTEAEVQNSISCRVRVLKQFHVESLSPSSVLNACREQKGTEGKGREGKGREGGNNVAQGAFLNSMPR